MFFFPYHLYHTLHVAQFKVLTVFHREASAHGLVLDKFFY